MTNVSCKIISFLLALLPGAQCPDVTVLQTHPRHPEPSPLGDHKASDAGAMDGEGAPS